MESSTFSLDDYDSIGFDLDCTLAEYNVKELIKLIYDLLVDYLIKNKSYERENLMISFDEEGEYFLQKGLVMDFKKGNVLQIGAKGEILKATHGTKCLSDEEILKQYGPEKTFSVFKDFLKDPLLLMNNPYERVLRATLDCFDMACTLIYAKIVDHLDKKSDEIPVNYYIWPDILAGLYRLYSRNHFATGESEFFSALKSNPSLYYKKWTLEKLDWLKKLKSKKFVFLLTGSHIDFAELTASYCIGENWKEYFDVILCYGKKPSFFFTENPFLNIEGVKETEPVGQDGLQVNGVYSQGNWKELLALISEKTNKGKPKCLYVGDNLLLDVYAPAHFKCCQSVAVSLELKDEFKSSPLWGSYFGEANRENITYWNHLIKNYAEICVSGLDVFLKRPFSFRYHCLKSGPPNELNETNGYYIK